MGFWSNLTGTTSRESHDDGSYTDRGNGHIKSTTYKKDGSLRQYSTDHNPLIGPNESRTYDSDGKLINSQIK